jgi:Leucine-rich repeat (LRR) protein
MKSLEVIDIEASLVDALPDSIGELKNLKVLNLTGTKILQLPKSIDQLTQLRLLKLLKCPVTELPQSLEENQNLSIISKRVTTRLANLVTEVPTLTLDITPTKERPLLLDNYLEVLMVQ